MTARRGIHADIELRHRGAGLEQLRQFRDIGLGNRPFRTENLQPALLLQRPHHRNRIFLVRDLLDLISDGASADELNVFAFARGIIAGAGALLQLPSKTRGKTRGANQSRRIFQKRVAVQNPDQPRFDISSAVERVEQQAARAIVQRERHRIESKVAAAEIFVDRGRGHQGRFAGLVEDLGAGHADLGPRALKNRVDHAEDRIDHIHDSARFFNVVLQLQRIALNREIQVTNGEPGQNVANCPPGQIDVHAVGSGNFLHHVHRPHLLGR